MSDMASEQGVENVPAPDTSAPAETTQEAAPGIDMSALADALSERFEPQFEQLRGAINPEPEPEVADPYVGLGELGYSDEETSMTRNVLEGIFEQKMTQAVGPLQQEINRLRSELDYGDLEERYPALATPEGAERVMSESRQAAVDIARGLGLPAEQAQQLAMSPKLMEFVHLAQIGRERAAQEQPPRAGTELEQPGGASPPEPEPDVNDQILGAAPPKNFWNY